MGSSTAISIVCQPIAKVSDGFNSAVAVVEREGRVLLFRRRDDEELMAGIWELPQVDVTDLSNTSPSRDLAKTAGRLQQQYGGNWKLEASNDSFVRVRTTRILAESTALCQQPAEKTAREYS